MNKKGKGWVFVLAILVVALVLTSVFGISSRYGDISTPIVKKASDVQKGTDIRGGLEITLGTASGNPVEADKLPAIQNTLARRALALGYTDYELYTDTHTSNITLRLAWNGEEPEDFSAESVLASLGVTGAFTVRGGTSADSENIIMTNTDVTSASVSPASSDEGADEYIVYLTINENSQQTLSSILMTLMEGDGTMSYWMDDTLLATGNVSDIFSIQQMQLPGTYTEAEANAIANQINGGTLSVPMTVVSYTVIAPSSTQNVMQGLTWAGIAALVLVAVWMLLRYRLVGLVAVFSMAGYVAALASLLSGFFDVFNGTVLTLAGAVGVLLAVGLCVGMNILQGEFIREDARASKRIDLAVRNGLHKANKPIIYGSILFAIAGALLMGIFGPTEAAFGNVLSFLFRWFGPSLSHGAYSFGLTLLVGTALNVVFGLFVTRYMLVSLVKFKSLSSPWLYGGAKNGAVATRKKMRNFISGRKVVFALTAVVSIAAIVVGVVLMPVDSEYKGGSTLVYSYEGDLSADLLLAQSTTLFEQATVSAAGGELVISRESAYTAEDAVALQKVLQEQYPDNAVVLQSASSTDGKMATKFVYRNLLAIVLVLVVLVIYVAFRYRWIGSMRSGLTAMLAMVCNVAIVYGAYALTGVAFTAAFAVVALFVMVYSVDMSAILCDRVRENNALYNKASFAENVNLSINQGARGIVSRTVALTLVLGSALVIGLVYNIPTIFTLALALLVGVLASAFTGGYMAPALWVMWEDKRMRNYRKGRKVENYDKLVAKQVEKAARLAGTPEEAVKAPANKKNGKKDVVNEVSIFAVKKEYDDGVRVDAVVITESDDDDAEDEE